MKALVLLEILRAGALPENKGAFLEVATNEGPRQIRFTFQDAERLSAAILEAHRQLEKARNQAGEPALPKRAPQRWDTALDPVEQVAVLRTHFTDDTTEETRIPRSEILRITRFLDEALKRFEAGAELRQ